ncbi:MAG: tRNA adenosine(34) deaminase TadA [Deltaproteobacteria bacterium]|nr:tRNA adenosine(34) deaminase TadA [Deltaproteobacteria bacterium]MBW1944436.1 tRNA adenosine(34) deaminase TadA [Deltaproteobacteria bacterium]
MREALDEARKAFDEGEVPVGALVVDNEGRIMGKAHNRPVSLNDPTAHAEMLAIRRAAGMLGNYRLVGATLVATIEPCPMCMGAALNARVERLVYGAPDPKAGAAGSLYDLSSDSRLNHRIEVVSGVLQEECALLMQRFFRMRRSGEVPKWS